MEILLIDDTVKLRAAIKRCLEILGHTVTTAATIEEARHILAERAFDRIICDGDVSCEGDGADFAQQLTAEGRSAVIYTRAPERNARNNVKVVKKGGRTVEETVEQLLG